MSPTEFADAIKTERKRLHITQPQAATILGYSPRSIAKWEAGEAPKLKPVVMDGVLKILKGCKPKKQAKGT